MKSCVALLLVCVVAANAATIVKNVKSGFSWGNCNADDPIQFTEFVISPDPILIPGSVTFTEEFTFGVAVTSPTQGNFTYQHYDGTQWNTIKEYYYEDVCVMLDIVYPPDQPCPQIYADSGATCRCPFPVGNMAIDNLTYNFTGDLSIPEGSYKVSGVLTAGNAELACYWFICDVEAAV